MICKTEACRAVLSVLVLRSAYCLARTTDDMVSCLASTGATAAV